MWFSNCVYKANCEIPLGSLTCLSKQSRLESLFFFCIFNVPLIILPSKVETWGNMYFLLLLNNSLEVLEATSFPFRYVLGFPFAKSIDSLIQQRHLTLCYKCRHKIDIFKTVHCCVAILKSSKIFLDKLQSMTPCTLQITHLKRFLKAALSTQWML